MIKYLLWDPKHLTNSMTNEVLIMVLENFEIWYFDEIIQTCKYSKSLIMVNTGS